jgi:hypothetical protein
MRFRPPPEFPVYEARLRFHRTEDGGFSGPLKDWPIRIKVRFEENPRLSYGAVLLQGEQGVVHPGSSLILEMVFLNYEETSLFLHQWKRFSFGDIKERGIGWIVSMPHS